MAKNNVFKAFDGDQELNPNQFRIPAADPKGHSERIWCNIQPGHAKVVSDIVESRKFPYRSRADFYRHALQRHIQWTNSINPVPSVVGQVDAIMEIIRRAEYHNDYQKTFDVLGSTVANLLGNGKDGMGEAIRLVQRVKAGILAMPEEDSESAYWKAIYLRTLEDNHGHMIKSQPKGSFNLANMNDDNEDGDNTE